MPLESATYLSGLVASNPSGSDDRSQGDDHIRLIKQLLLNTFPGASKAIRIQQASVDVASAATTDVGAASSDFVTITGTTTITGFGTVAAGVTRWIRFAGSLLLTYDGSTLILPTADDIMTAAGDFAFAISLGGGNWRVPLFMRANGKPLVGPDFSEVGVIDALTELTSIALDDWLVAGDTSASNAAKKLSPLTLLKVIALLTEITTFDETGDLLLVVDASDSSIPKVIKGENVRVGEAALADLAPGTMLAMLDYRLSTGTGESVDSDWATRPLNTEVYDRLGLVSLGSNRFTISTAGTYEISWRAPHFGGGKTRLYNVSDSSVVEYANGGRWPGGTGNTMTYSEGCAIVTIAGSKQFEIQNDGNGGNAYNASPAPEIYLQVRIRKG